MRIRQTLTAILALAALGGGAPVDPLTAPIAPDVAARMLEAKAPSRVHGGTWLVGTAAINVALIDTGAGLVLIDAGLPQATPMVEANMAAAGFSIRDVKLILSSEPHYDHAGGLAALARDSGAPVLASPEAARVLRAGRSGDEDPQLTTLFAYPPVQRIRLVRDGETIRLGRTAIKAHATPGHTPGSMSWSWRSCVGSDCRQIVFAASLNSLTDGKYRFSDPKRAEALAAFRRSFPMLRALPCDILLTGHPDHGKSGPGEPACIHMADRYEAALDQRLATERKAD